MPVSPVAQTAPAPSSSTPTVGLLFRVTVVVKSPSSEQGPSTTWAATLMSKELEGPVGQPSFLRQVSVTLPVAVGTRQQ